MRPATMTPAIARQRTRAAMLGIIREVAITRGESADALLDEVRSESLMDAAREALREAESRKMANGE